MNESLQQNSVTIERNISLIGAKPTCFIAKRAK